MVGTLVEIKGLGIGEPLGYASFRAEQEQLKPIDCRAAKVHKEYCKAAKDLDTSAMGPVWTLYVPAVLTAS